MMPKGKKLIAFRSETGHAGERVRIGEPRGISDEHGRLPPIDMPSEEQRQMVMVLAANGNAHDVISKVIKISEKTLRKYCKAELAEGRLHVKARIGAAVVREALAGNVAAQRYWLVTHGGPEWQLPTGMLNAYGDIAHGKTGSGDADVVHFYMPPNGRDLPEPDEEVTFPPLIEGEPAVKTGTDDQ